MSDGDGSSEMTGRSRVDRSTGLHKLTSYHLRTANEPAKFRIDRRFMFLVLKHIPQIIRSFRRTKYVRVFKRIASPMEEPGLLWHSGCCSIQWSTGVGNTNRNKERSWRNWWCFQRVLVFLLSKVTWLKRSVVGRHHQCLHPMFKLNFFSPVKADCLVSLPKNFWI